MGMQVSCGVYPEVSAQGDVRADTPRAWADHAGVGPTERERGGGRASEGGSCAHDVVDTAEVFGLRGGGVYQGEECDSDRPKIYGSDEELCRVELLGEGILRVDGGAGRSASTPVHQRARQRRSSARSTEDVRIGYVPAQPAKPL